MQPRRDRISSRASVSGPGGRGLDSRLGGFGENLLPQLAGTSPLDRVECVVDPDRSEVERRQFSKSFGPAPLLDMRALSNPRDDMRESTYSSAPSMVTSMAGNWSMSPSSRPAERISSFDWKPGSRRGKRHATISVLIYGGRAWVRSRCPLRSWRWRGGRAESGLTCREEHSAGVGLLALGHDPLDNVRHSRTRSNTNDLYARQGERRRVSAGRDG